MHHCAYSTGSGSCEINDGSNNGGNDNPEKLKPVKKREVEKDWSIPTIEGRPEQHYEGDDQQQAEPVAAPALRTSNHTMFSFDHEI
jgi:hypothetical protein